MVVTSCSTGTLQISNSGAARHRHCLYGYPRTLLEPELVQASKMQSMETGLVEGLSLHLIFLPPGLHTGLSHGQRSAECSGLEFNHEGFQNWVKTAGAHGPSVTVTRHVIMSVLWELLFPPAFYFTRFYCVLGAKASCDCVTVTSQYAL